MKRWKWAVGGLALLAVAIGLLLVGVPGHGGVAEATANGAPSGPHYNLNIHGVAKGQGFSAQGGSNTHNIFVPLWGNCKIDLQEGDYQVINPNCVTDNALFQLPNPDNGTGNLAYSVYARALTPGSASMSTCFTDTTTNSTWCNAGTLVVSLNKVTPPKFTNVSKQLLQVCVTDQTTGKSSLEPLFGNANYDYFWNYDNQGLRLAQLRFYPIATTPIGGDCTGNTTQQ